MKNRTVISWLVLASVLVSLLGMAVFAADTGRFVVSDAQGGPGDTVKITVSIEDNPGIIAAAVKVCYDDAKLELISVKDEKLLPNSMFSQQYTSNPYHASWLDALAAADHHEDGVLMTLTFRILEGCAAGATEIRLDFRESDVFDRALKAQPFDSVSGTVTVGNGDEKDGESKPNGSVGNGQVNVPEQPTENLYQRFEDLEAGAWYQRYAEYMLDRGYMNGVSDTMFQPNGSVTRAQLVTILYRMEGAPGMSGMTQPFDDVQAGTWYGDAVTWAAANGIVNGVAEGQFAPNDPVTREQIAAILYRYNGMAVTETDRLSRFSDAAAISDYARAAMNWAVDVGILNGSDGRLMPGASATRVQAAVMLTRYAEQQTLIPVPIDPTIKTQ